MLVNPTVAKWDARAVAPHGMGLWRRLIGPYLVEAGSNPSSSNGSGGVRLSLAPAQIRQELAAFAELSSDSKQFVDDPKNRNLASHIGALSQLLTIYDDPLTITGGELTNRCAG